ncbi:hypothetical protein [Pseudohoeflea suaedae]|uniref:hypothetical protein n=1 Tax=Pseudohoeflea suaedae TaxID=877384 RepID=UPI001304ED6B|nr:hypothetical protein [Pseudohoeflea suaedae]
MKLNNGEFTAGQNFLFIRKDIVFFSLDATIRARASRSLTAFTRLSSAVIAT